ncbi:VAN3-binding protein-like [Wolffia australiana]
MEIPRDPMELLSRSWTLSQAPVQAIAEEEAELEAAMATSPFSFSTSSTSRLVLERIMALSDGSPRTSNRLSHSSGPLNGGSLSDSPPVSPSQAHNFNKNTRAAAPQARAGSRSVGRWLKDRRERKKEVTRVQKAEVHAAVSVAGVAAAVAAVAAAAAANSPADVAVASAAALVAAHCVDAAEVLGAASDQLVAVVGSAVNVRCSSDVITLTAAAATALRAAATLKARTFKEVWNTAAVTPLERAHPQARRCRQGAANDDDGSEIEVEEESFLELCSRDLLMRGTELLKRTRKGDLHWKVVSVYINKAGQVMLKMKSRHVAGTIKKKKKSVVTSVRGDVVPWPERRLMDGVEERRYFGLMTAEGRLVEFECSSQREHTLWTSGVESLLAAASSVKPTVSA